MCIIGKVFFIVKIFKDLYHDWLQTTPGAPLLVYKHFVITVCVFGSQWNTADTFCLNQTQKFQKLCDKSQLWSESSSDWHCLATHICISTNAYNSSINPHHFLRSHEEMAFYVKFSSWSSNKTSAFIITKKRRSSGFCSCKYNLRYKLSNISHLKVLFKKMSSPFSFSSVDGNSLQFWDAQGCQAADACSWNGHLGRKKTYYLSLRDILQEHHFL